MPSPTTENIIFPNGIDTFPNVYEPSSGVNNTPSNTIVWATYYNKIRNFIGVVEPMLTPYTATSPSGSLVGLSSIFAATISMQQLTDYLAKNTNPNGTSIPSQVLPFEVIFVDQSDPNSYTTIPNFKPVNPFIFNSPQYNLSNIIGIGDSTVTNFYNAHPQVSCTLYEDPGDYINYQYPSNNANPRSHLCRYTVNSYVICNSTCLIVRGAIYDLMGHFLPPIANPPINYHWRSEVSLRVSISYARTVGS